MLFLTYFGLSRFLVVFLLTPMGCMTLTYPQKVNIERYLANGEDIIQLSPAEIAKLLAELGKLFCLTVPEITEILSIVKLGFGVAEFLKIIYETACNGTHPGTEEQLLSMFEIIALRLEQIERRVVEIEDTLKTLAKDLPNLIRWEIAINTVESYTIPINSLYRRFQYYQQHKGKIENATLIAFAYGVVSDNTDSIQSYMADLHSLVSPDDHGTEHISLRPEDEYEVLKESVSEPAATTDEVLPTNRSLERRKIRSLRGGIFSILEDVLQDYDSCRSKQSSQQLIFGFYAMLSITQARGYAMVNFSYKILKHFHKGNFTIETKLADENYDFYTNKLMEIGKSVISRSDNSVRNCDPSIYVEGENYVMVTELLQGYIENQVDLNTGGTCTGVCSDFRQSKVEGCYMGETEYCGKHPTCHGQLYNCSFISYYSTVCPSSSPHRRLDWVKYSGLPVMGKQELNPTCPNQLEVDSWLRGFVYCKYCFCLCDDSGSPTSDRFVSLRPNFSNVTDGKVVTGARFIKRGRVLHLQIQEGKAMAQGQVDPDTIQWVDVEPIIVNSSEYQEGRDYISLNYEVRDFDLDSLEAPQDHVVTGLKFRKIGSHINLKMQAMRINFTSGVLKPDSSIWVSNSATPNTPIKPRRQLILNDPDDSRMQDTESKVDSTSNMYISLGPTSIKKDVAQLTVPFFDSQPVSAEPKTWLGGIQLYHRGEDGFGGFIAPGIFSYNLTHHFDKPENKSSPINVSETELISVVQVS